jgi:hypothetical protein
VLEASGSASEASTGEETGAGGCAFSAGMPVTLVTGQSSPASIAVDGESVYWINADLGSRWAPGSVAKVPVCGGAPVTLWSGADALPSIALDASGVLFFGGSAPALSRVPKAGGPLTGLADVASSPGSLEVDSAVVYWTEVDRTFGTGGVRLMEIPPGSGPVTLASSHDDWGGALITDSTRVYWTGGSNLYSMPKRGGAIVTLATMFYAGPRAVDENNLYWTASDGLYSMPKTGGTPRRLAQTFGAGAIVADGEYLYWTIDLPIGAVLKMPATGGPITTLASGQSQPSSLTVDATSIYWTIWYVISEVGDDGAVLQNGAIVKLTPK